MHNTIELKFPKTQSACAFTGHRPERFSFGYDEQYERCLKLKARLREQIEALIAEGVSTFYTGMARGTDQWAASIVLSVKNGSVNSDHNSNPNNNCHSPSASHDPGIKLIAVVPHEGQANSWSDDQREVYYDTLALCDDVITLNTRYTPSCYFERNRYLVDHAEYILAVYDGGEKGGTAYTVSYARQQGRRVIVIDPETLAVTKD